ncbi:amidohydrolase family protein [Microbacterium elymi]|uniref:Amidohydrolase n=1 Tax=Microbacterium elymi TaxID=2909587 RepID=A0ABY5NI57_9MICO|nr:amidohydrolase [Microbacterium elymi]UUT34879.1 amidohydrolase [Microbacterium elymi]
MIVDAHAHFLPSGYPDDAPACFPHMEPIDGSADRLLVFDKMRFAAKEVFFQAERRVEAMDAADIDAEVISPMPPLLRYDLPPADGLALARHVNDTAAELAAYAPERIIPLGMVPMQDPDAAADELAAIRQRGLAGVEIASNILGDSIGHERFLPFFQEAQRQGISVFVHAMPSPTDRLPMSGMGTYVVGIEGAFAAASLILGGTAAACPDLRISFSHAAGGFPLMLPRANYFWAAAGTRSHAIWTAP